MKSNAFKVSVVITAYKIGPVLSDTIHSVLSQQEVEFGNIVVVVDGCGYTRTTRNTLSRFSRGHKGLVHFIWVDNGGVSRARNIGARWILEYQPDTDGIYYIDGDDLLNPLAITKSVTALRQAQAVTPDENIGWTYCNQNQFGDGAPSLEYPRNTAPTMWLSNNMSQPSCLIDRKMFDAGVFWDEDMRQGIEDWEYWLTAIEAGFIGTNVRDVYLKYRRLTGNRSSLNRANDAITKDYMRRKHKALYTAAFFLDNEHARFPRWAYSHNDSPMTFDVGTDISLPMVTRDHEYLRQALGYRFSIGKIDTTILEPYFPDMIAFISPYDAQCLNDLKMSQSTLREMESIVSKHGCCTLSISALQKIQNDRHDHIDGIQLTQNITSPEPLASRYFSSFFISIKKLFELLELKNNQWSDVDVVNSVNNFSPSHMEMTITGMEIPDRVDPLPEQSVCTRLNNLVVELHRIYRLPPALSLLHRDNHDLCAAHLANHEILGTDIFGVWPILPKLKRNKQQIGLLVSEDTRHQLAEIIQDISSVTTELDFEVNVLILSDKATMTDLVEIPVIASVGLMKRSLDMPVVEQHNGYLGLPAYELLDELTQQDIHGYMTSMDIVIDLCGPRAAGIMMKLKALGIHTSTCINNVCPHMLTEASTGNDATREWDNSTEVPTDPVAIQAYSGAYTNLIVPNYSDAQKLTSYGVTSSTMVSSVADLLSRLFDQIIYERSANSIGMTSSHATESEHSLAA